MKKVLHSFGGGGYQFVVYLLKKLLKTIILKQIADEKESMQHYHTGKEFTLYLLVSPECL